MRLWSLRPLVMTAIVALGLVASACGGADNTPTAAVPTATQPVPTPTRAAPAPTSGPRTAAPATPTIALATGGAATATPAQTVTRPASTPTAAPVPAATPTLAPGGLPRPTIVLGGKRGGILNTSIRSSYILVFDTYSSGSLGAIPAHNLFLNNLAWRDPYGDGKVIVGDLAESWIFSDAGKAITFNLRKGIVYHDGTPFGAKDVVYNIERGWKPRGPRMIDLQTKLANLQAVEAVNDSTVKVTLKQPSNYTFTAMTIPQFTMYPAHVPLPENDAKWQATGIGTGPFKMKQTIPETRIEAVRNDSYWKSGLPYLDGVNFNVINDESLVVASYRTGRIDATSLDYSPLIPFLVNNTLQRERGFAPHWVITGALGIQFVGRAPWTNPLVREAADLVLKRHDALNLAYNGQGTAYASPLLPPEFGGQWGLSAEEMKNRPGYRENDAADVARAKRLLQQAGVDPSRETVRIIGSTALLRFLETTEAGIRELGFKTQIQPLEAGTFTEATAARKFEIAQASVGVSSDDPLDYLAPYVMAKANNNVTDSSDPELDRWFQEQDATLDTAKRKQITRDIQERVMTNRYTVMLVWRTVPAGGNGYVKNYPSKLPFAFDSRFRWEQVWLER